MWFKMLAKIGSRLQQREKYNQRKMSRKAKRLVESLEARTLFSFSMPVSYAAGGAPVDMISGDFNGDGRPDVLTTNSLPAVVTTLLSNGDGTFSAPISSPLSGTPGSQYTGSQAGTAATGDFNHDGKLDVAVISGQGATIMLGNGDGSFTADGSVVLGTSPARLSAADVNGDGAADILAANINGTVSVTLSNGDGTFAPRTEYLAGSSPQDVQAADFNHDGKLDIAVANAISAGYVTVMYGNGDGTFQGSRSYAAFSAPYRMNIADYNGDGNMDIGVANSYTSACVTVLAGNPDGTFQPYQSYNTGSQPWELQSRDVNGDGMADLVDSNGSTYQIELNNGDGTFGLPTSTAGAGWVFAAEDFNGDGTADIAGASGSSVGVLINNTPAMTNVSTATHFVVSTTPATIAGAPMSLTISAVDSAGNVVSDFTGLVHISSTDTRMPAQAYTFVAGDAGTHTLSLSLYTAGNQTVSVSGPNALLGNTDVQVSAAAVGKFGISADTSVIAGNAGAFTVTAQDNYGNLVSNYTGTIHFTSSDAQATVPADYTFAAADNGVASFSATLRTAGNQTISATDTTTASIRGTSAGTAVAASTPVSLGLIGGGGHIGAPHMVTVVARDAFGNVATGYNGTIHLSASDANMVLPADGELTGGIGYFSVTPMTLGTQTLSATDAATGTLAGTETITGTPGDAAVFAMTPIAGTTAGVSQSFTLTAYDAFGNVAVDYSGTVAVTSSDYQAGVSYFTFGAADLGTKTLSVTLRTAGTQSVTARDLYNPAISATQTGINVSAATATSITVTPPHGTTAGVAQNVTITARDAIGNIASGYRGILNFSSSDTIATLPANYTFTAADAGTHTFSITFKSSGGQTISILDTTNPAMTYFQRDIQVVAGAMTGFSFRAPSNVTAGTAFSITLSAVDAFGNVVTGYTGKVRFSGPTGIPADYQFTSLDAGTHTFTMTLSSTGTQTIGVQDTVTGSLKSSVQLTVKTGSTSTGGGTATGGGGGGGTATGGGTSTGGGGGGGKKVP